MHGYGGICPLVRDIIQEKKDSNEFTYFKTTFNDMESGKTQIIKIGVFDGFITDTPEDSIAVIIYTPGTPGGEKFFNDKYVAF